MDDIKRNAEGLRELALFAGAGGGILGGILLGWRTICAVEYNAYARSVLLARQNDGTLPPFPIWDDVRTFDGKPWCGLVDVVSGGFPCQDISAAGKGAGLDGERSGLWSEMARIIGEVRPRFAFIENSPLLTIRGICDVMSDLALLGYDAEWGVISAGGLGANHIRKRIWIVAHSRSHGCQVGDNEPCACGEEIYQNRRCSARRTPIARNDTDTERWKFPLGGNATRIRRIGKCLSWDGDWPLADKPVMDRTENEPAFRLDRLKALGNAQCARVAATAFTILSERF